MTISKKMRKSSRFYNKVLRGSTDAIQGMNKKSIARFRINRRRNTEADIRSRPALSIPPISVMRRREEKTQRQSVFAFIPRSARAILKLIRGAA